MASEGKSTSCVEVMEYTTMKASYESLNKRYRKNHRDMEKSIVTLNKSLEELDNVSDIHKAKAELMKVLEGVSSVKRKAENFSFEERKLLKSCKRRIEHLAQLCSLEVGSENKQTGDNQTETKSDERNSKTEGDESDATLIPSNPMQPINEKNVLLCRFMRHLTDYLFATGQPLSALHFSQEKRELGDLCLTEVFEETVNIEKALMNGDTSLAHAWLQEANFKLKKNDSHYEFDLRVFEFYLLVRQGKRMEAIQHARKYMSTVKEEDGYRSTKLGQAMILLAMRTPEELDEKANQNSLTEKWIVNRTHEVIMEFYSYNVHIPFYLAIIAGITAIKTHYCYSRATHNRDCAVCHPLMNQLAVNLPYGRHDHSVLTCYQTKLPMNDDNPPMSLPNGYVYSQKGIAELTKSDGTLTCPRSGETFELSQIQRVYIV